MTKVIKWLGGTIVVFLAGYIVAFLNEIVPPPKELACSTLRIGCQPASRQSPDSAGTGQRLAVSCQAIENDNPSAKPETLVNCQASGKNRCYKLSGSDGSTYNAYCDMTSDGGGWTLVAKIQKDTAHWRFDSPNWTVRGTNFHEEDFGLMSDEARYPAFENVPFKQLRVVDPERNRRMTAILSADNLLSVFNNSNSRNLSISEYAPELFTYFSSRSDSGTFSTYPCPKYIEAKSREIQINNEDVLVASDPPHRSAKSQTRLGALWHHSNDHVWATINDCAIGLGITTSGVGGSKETGTTTQSGFSTIWVR